MGKHHRDVEGGGGAACPYMIESSQLRWAFIRKVYAIVALQLLVTIAVAATIYFVPDFRRFFLARTPASLAAFVLIIVAPIIVMIPMMCLRDRHPINLILLALFTICMSFSVGYGIVMIPMMCLRDRHPINLILLALFTICMSFSVGLGCLSAKDLVIIEAASLTFVVVFGLTIYTFWTDKRGQDFSFLSPFLAAACLVLMLYGLVQMLLPMGKAATTAYGCIAALVFSGFIVYDTDNLIKRHTYNEYVTAAISLYLDIINIFMAIVTVLSSDD